MGGIQCRRCPLAIRFVDIAISPSVDVAGDARKSVQNLIGQGATQVNRTRVIQEIVDSRKTRSYLEIGMGRGDNFFAIEAACKVAIEPAVECSATCETKCIPVEVYRPGAKCYKCTSDAYFSLGAADGPFDVVFIDGLHTHAQSRRDVMNSLGSLNDNGVIVMHDCNPPFETAAYPAESVEQAFADLRGRGWRRSLVWGRVEDRLLSPGPETRLEGIRVGLRFRIGNSDER